MTIALCDLHVWRKTKKSNNNFSFFVLCFLQITSLNAWLVGNHIGLILDQLTSKYVEQEATSQDFGVKEIKRPDLIWDTREVPYAVANNFGRIDLLNEAFKDIEEASCIKFRLKIPTDQLYIYFLWINDNDSGSCTSFSVGRVTAGPQSVALGIPCLNKGSFIHEILHALGFYHEHQRPDRNAFVSIIWDNIIEKTRTNYAMVLDASIFGKSYDYGSIMHYGSMDHSRNGKNTIRVVDNMTRNAAKLMGQRKGLSRNDKLQLQLRYNCAATCCLKIPEAPHFGGVVVLSHKIGGQLKYFCDHGKTLVGTSEAYCSLIGPHWTGTTPYCIDSPLMHCSFEEELGCPLWTIEVERHRGRPIAAPWTPAADYTQRNHKGYYLALNNKAEFGQIVTRDTFEIKQAMDVCISFAYFLQGFASENITVELFDEDYNLIKELATLRPTHEEKPPLKPFLRKFHKKQISKVSKPIDVGDTRKEWQIFEHRFNFIGKFKLSIKLNKSREGKNLPSIDELLIRRC